MEPTRKLTRHVSADDRSIRIVSDINLTAAAAVVTIDHLRDRKHLRRLRLLQRLVGADAIIMRLPSKHTALLCLLAKLRSPRTRLVYYDVNIPVATGWWDRLKRKLYLSLVRQADLILTLHADTAEYARLLRLPQSRIVYVGFKSNGWEDRESVERGYETRDSGSYVLACGRSYRDFATFARAMAEAGLPARILVTQGDLKREGSIPPPEPLPENVQVIKHDGSRSTWIETILGARIVVVPLRGDVIQPAGVSVYLEAMNLSRTVIVTDGPSSRFMLDDSMVGLVPAGDAQALAREAVRIWNDSDRRNRCVENALSYVQELGGVERMSRDILKATATLFDNPVLGDLGITGRGDNDRSISRAMDQS